MRYRTDAELADLRRYILAHAGKQTPTQMAQHLGLKHTAVRSIAQAAGVSLALGPKEPTEQERAWMRALFLEGVTPVEIGQKLEWPTRHVRRVCADLEVDLAARRAYRARKKALSAA